MGNLTNILNFDPGWIPSPEDQMRIRMEGMDLYPGSIVLDGVIHRFSTRPEDPSDTAGWYMGFSDGIPAGAFGNWRTGDSWTWTADMGREISALERIQNANRMAEAKRRAQVEREQNREYAAARATEIWEKLVESSPEHPYLQKKGIEPHIARTDAAGNLVTPLFDVDGNIWSLQFIAQDGTKRFLPGGATKGNFAHLGGQIKNKLYIAEGFATAATVVEVTKTPCLAAYSAGNLVSVVEAVRNKYPALEIIIVADNDASGVGKNHADQAAAKFGATVIMPPIEGMDVNDYRQAGQDVNGLLIVTGAAMQKKKVIFGDDLPDEWEAPDEIIQGMITRNSIAIIYGDSNSGKTFFALSLARAISSGGDCYGRKVEAGIVLYLATEAPGSIKSRLQAIRRHTGEDIGNIAIVPVPVNFYSSQADAVDIMQICQEIEQIRGKKVSLIIADTLARISAGANENSGEDMGPVMERFDAIREETGSAILIIHHTGKDVARGARGWSGLRAHVDTEIEVNEKDGERSASITKQRELSSKGDVINFRLEVVEMGVSKFGETASTCIAVPDNEGRAVKTKEDKKLEERKRDFQDAWFDSGMEDLNGMPYVTRSALVDYYTDRKGKARSTAVNYAKPKYKDGLVCQLIERGIIEEFGHGFLVKDDGFSSVMLMIRKEKSN